MSTGAEPRSTAAIETDMAEVERRLTELVRETITWNLKVGRLHLRWPIGPQRLFVMFVSFHLMVGVGGALLLLRASGRAAA
jgi:hypothetical protein